MSRWTPASPGEAAKPTVLRFPDHRGAGFGCDRLLACARVLLGVEIAVFLFFVAGTHGLIVPLAASTSTDFVSFYAAGTLADAGTPQLAYDRSVHEAAEQQATAPGVEYRFFYYPPVFLLLCAALARLPYIAAFVIFEAATFALYLLTMRGILVGRRWSAMIPGVAFPVVFWAFGLGQNSFLTAALFGAGTLCIDRRPILAGLCFGALCYKPHFAVLVPVALLAGCHWRALAATSGAAAALCGLSLIAFGWETWNAFFAAGAASLATYASGRINFGGFVSPFGGVLLTGGSPHTAFAVQASVTLATGLLVTFVWRRRLPLPVRAATLTAATLLAIPIILIYDLLLAAVAAAWLIRDPAGPADWEIRVLTVLFALAIIPPGLSEAWHLPSAPILALALVGLIVARVFGQTSTASQAAPN